MKQTIICIFVLAFLFTLGTGVSLAEEKVPNMVGSWHGKSLMHSKEKGFKQDEMPTKFIVEKQQGRVFSGKKIWISNKKEMSENFSGVVSINNDKIYIAEHSDGYVFGDIVSKDKIVIYYVEDGGSSKVIITELVRVKK